METETHRDRLTDSFGARVASQDMAEEQWWYDLNTKSVVSTDNKTKVTDKLGPYASREEAERALDKVQERNEDYDNDPNWSD